MRNEFQRIARLARRFGAAPAGVLGIGDDCAVLPACERPMAITVDASVEGVHFDRAWIALDVAAARATEAAMSDLAAMGASVTGPGTGLLSALMLPSGVSDEDFDLLVDGVARAAERVGAVVLGGNLSGGPVLSVTTTAMGRVDGRVITRAGGRVGDALWVTGTPGAAAVGLCALRAGRGGESAFARWVTAWRAPRARLDEGVAMARFASAAVDVSDGLAQDAGHLARASKCAVVIDAARLDLSSEQRDAAGALGEEAVELALHGGEDYELLFSARASESAPADSAGWRAIGELVQGEAGAVMLRERDGTVRRVRAGGWDHFARP